MAFQDLLISEIFHSLQGETSLSGVPFAFIRLTGCNLRCTYCDTTYSFKGGKKIRISEVLDIIQPFQVKHALITGGEPLIQRQTPALLQALVEANYQVSIETHGELPIGSVVEKARIILDIKTPSSGMCRGGFEKNLPLLKPTDEVKFVIASENDYHWAKSWLPKIRTHEILFSAANPAQNSPGQFSAVSPTWLAEQILKDKLPVRLQVQLHKILWGNQRGV